MRTLLEKAREAQAIRISTDANADLSRIATGGYTRGNCQLIMSRTAEEAAP